MQKYQIGDIIKIKEGYKTIPGVKDLKPGEYIIIRFRPSFLNSEMVYGFKSTRKNSVYEYYYTQNWVEKNSEKIK